MRITTWEGSDVVKGLDEDGYVLYTSRLERWQSDCLVFDIMKGSVVEIKA